MHPDLPRLTDLLQGGRICVLTGAGVSTESGIPDYRGPETARRARNPIRFKQFLDESGAQQRYWARAYVGWNRVAHARPNPGHRALARMEAGGLLTGLITQNVDRLHHKAGSREVIELHGALDEVICLSCERLSPRAELQTRLAELNPGWGLDTPVDAAPDGDAELSGSPVARFRIAACAHCAGPLKPHVVFFGENVPKTRVERSYALLEAADALLVVGSSLTVFSGYRFVRRAEQLGRPVAIVNLGPTRGDPHAALHVDGPAGAVLPALAEALLDRAQLSPPATGGRARPD